MKNRGFFLLELVVAIAILSVGVTFVIQAFSSSARANALSGDIIDAVFLAEDKIQELEFKENRGLINQEPPEVTGNSGRFEWRYSFVPVQDTDLRLLQLTINWQRLKRMQDLSVYTYVR